MSWQENFRGTIKKKELLKRHTTFKIGGPVDYYVTPRDLTDLKVLITVLERDKMPFFVIGAGSNLLVSDKGLKGMVIRLDAASFRRVDFRGSSVEAGSGVFLKELITKSAQRGLSGLEFLAGIPGTIGGATVMNAGAWGRSIGELISSVTVMDYGGRIKTLNKEKIKFEYRNSDLGSCIILNAVLKLRRAPREKIRDRIEKYLRMRRKSQGCMQPNAGCIFKNPPGNSAGRLIDILGLKGKRIGGAVVSDKHANFILNQKDAKAADVIKLMSLIKKKVKKKFNVRLAPEIKIWK